MWPHQPVFNGAIARQCLETAQLTATAFKTHVYTHRSRDKFMLSSITNSDIFGYSIYMFLVCSWCSMFLRIAQASFDLRSTSRGFHASACSNAKARKDSRRSRGPCREATSMVRALKWQCLFTQVRT